MSEQHRNGSEGHALPATAAQAGLGALPIGSFQSRAAARALANARGESSWDEEARPPKDLANLIHLARNRHAQAERDLSPLPIPSGKENTPRGRLRARINACRARASAHYVQIEKGERRVI